MTRTDEELAVELGDLGPLGLPEPFDAEGASFSALLRRIDPDALPAALTNRSAEELQRLLPETAEGTTVLALSFADGVVIAGDRRATAGHMISRKDMRKVFPADRFSAVAISGVAGPAMELAKIFTTELEHYEKVEGESLSLEGKANKLAHMVRAHMPLALQGLVIVPLFAGVDLASTEEGSPGRIFEYDPAGGRYLARDHAATGSGARDARGALRRDHDPTLGEDHAVRLTVSALFDAAEQDSATGGPDLIRRIYPIIAVIDRDGYRELEADDVADHVAEVVSEHEQRATRRS